MRLTKTLCFTLLLALCVPACSNFTASGRMDHAYKKHMKHIRVAKERRRKQMARDLAKMPKPNDTPPMPMMITTMDGPASVPSPETSE